MSDAISPFQLRVNLRVALLTRPRWSRANGDAEWRKLWREQRSHVLRSVQFNITCLRALKGGR